MILLDFTIYAVFIENIISMVFIIGNIPGISSQTSTVSHIPLRGVDDETTTKDCNQNVGSESYIVGLSLILLQEYVRSEV